MHNKPFYLRNLKSDLSSDSASVNFTSPKPLTRFYVEQIDNKDSLRKGFLDTLSASPDAVVSHMRDRRDELDSLFRPFRRTDTALAISLCLALFGNVSSSFAGESDVVSPNAKAGVSSEQSPPSPDTEVTDKHGDVPDWKDKDYVLAVIEKNPSAIIYAHESLLKDKDFIHAVINSAIEKDPIEYNTLHYVIQRTHESLKKDKDFMLAVIEMYSWFFHSAHETLKEDIHFIVAAIEKNDLLKGKIKNLRNEDFMLKAIAIDSSFFNSAAESLKNRKSFLLKAVKANLSVLRFVSDDLKKDRRFMLDAIKQNDEAYRFAHETLRENVRFIMSVVRAICSFGYCEGNFLKKDRDFMLKCIKRGGYAIQLADDSLRDDKNFILDAVKENYEVLRFAPSLQKDKEVVLAAMMQNTDAIELLSKSLKKDPDVLEAFFGQPSYDYKSLSEDLIKFDIDFPERFDLETLSKIVQNRKGLDVNEKQPLAVVIYPKLDDNGAFKNNQMSQLISRNYQVLYYEAGSDSEVYALLKEVISQSGKKADLFVLGGHGINTSINMGGAEAELRSKALKAFESGWLFNFKELMDIADQLGNIGDADDIDVSDSDEMIKKNLAELLSDESVIVVESCSTGQGMDAGNNVANLMSKVFPQATIYAPTVPTVILGYEYDSVGRVEGMNLNTGADTVYQIKPQNVAE